ncbi:DUF1642 domain-containing protein [Lactococcus lactis]|uniref:DUF1642 domain-containing protein n=1 Tax=Lactococcus lactis TaxID=1358 RepID=UPI001C1012B3|nr:DUF1642 domain-containing protein [Lactococcus lactis]MBU5242899.1 DUF1642 domain-containing protein [Lactococcus lactis]
MTKEMKRPTSHISGNSIKPALSKAVEFYTDNNRQAYECIHERDEYIDYLESQLSNAKPQQALPVVPECVGSFLTGKSIFKIANGDIPDDVISWVQEQTYYVDLEKIISHLISIKVTGYTVEKPQLFYLREKNTNYYLNKSKNNGLELVPNPYFDEDNQFTQSEIDSMQTGSYEQIEVAE